MNPQKKTDRFQNKFDIYVKEVTPTKGLSAQKHDKRATQLFLQAVGPNREPGTLSRRDWDRFIAARRSGELKPGKSWIKSARDRTVAQNLKTVIAVFNWATTSRDERGELLLERNPFRGFPLPVEANPARKTFTRKQYDDLAKGATAIDSTFALAVSVAYHTGHRIGAIRHLRWSDIDLTRGEIHWRAKHDKIGRQHVTPISKALGIVLERAQKARKAIGDGWLFPSPADLQRPCSRNIMRDWMERALIPLGIKRGDRYGWHSLRRQFATELKHVPLPDLCALGGWTDPQTILKCYARPDVETMRTALENRARRVASGS
jgi:integrase